MEALVSRGLAATAALLLAIASMGAAVAADDPVVPTDPPVVPLAVYDDPVGDVPGGAGPDIVSCSFSEPWQSLVSFSFEFAEDPPLAHDPGSMSTDELWVGLTTAATAVFPEEATHLLAVHSATLEEEAATGGTLCFTFLGVVLGPSMFAAVASGIALI